MLRRAMASRIDRCDEHVVRFNGGYRGSSKARMSRSLHVEVFFCLERFSKADRVMHTMSDPELNMSPVQTRQKNPFIFKSFTRAFEQFLCSGDARDAADLIEFLSDTTQPFHKFTIAL